VLRTILQVTGENDMAHKMVSLGSALARVEFLEQRSLLSATFLDAPVLPRLSPTPALNVSTVPPNGDVNPYGVAFVPKGFAAGGPLAAGGVPFS